MKNRLRKQASYVLLLRRRIVLVISKSMAASSETEEVAFILVYILFSVALVFPPSEFYSAGLTIENIFSSWLGSQHLDFVSYHIKRTAANVLVHSLLPLTFYFGLGLVSPQRHLFQFGQLSAAWQLWLGLSLVLPTLAVLLVLYWKNNGWANHPIARVLAHHRPVSGATATVPSDANPWLQVRASVNAEFLRIDKFSTGNGVYVTSSWIMKAGIYTLHLACQDDIHLTLINSENYQIHHQSRQPVQFITALVISVNPAVKPFTIRIHSTDYNDLKEKIQGPIVNARNIVIKMSLADQFLDAFKQVVSQNPVQHLPPHSQELEACIGCLQKKADVKLQKLCEDDASRGTGTTAAPKCVQCNCRPMWCLECMSKWFASRQDQSRTNTWLAGKSPCPTCRSVFCVRDVCLVVTS